MKSSELIDRLVHDLRPQASIHDRLVDAVASGALVASAQFLVSLGVRTDIALAVEDWQFASKLIVAIAFAAGASTVFLKLGRPEATLRSIWPQLGLAPVALAVAVAFELFKTSPDTWSTLATGHNALKCVTVIPLLSLAPLACLIRGLRHGAPAKPALAGFLSGLAASGISAALYAANCDDDSPLFIVIWYPLAILIVGLIGSIIGHRMLRW